MQGISAFFYKIFGASWFTSLVGYVLIAGGVAGIVKDTIDTQGVPTNASGWIALVAGIAARFSKQSNVSNAKEPMAVAQPVVAETGATFALHPPIVAKP